jgi:large subunit ribosomal protein L23
VNARDVIVRPLVTEQSMAGIAGGKYTFVVALHANKIEVRQAVETIWGVKVAKVNTMRVRGKVHRVGRFAGRRPDWKKAIVTLKPGESIRDFEGLV